MVIETSRRLTKSEAKEITNILMSARQLIRNPRKKLTNMFGFCLMGAIFCAFSLLFFLCSILLWGESDALRLTGILISIIGMVFVAVFYYAVNKTYRSLLDRGEEKVTVTLDEKGIDYEVPGSKRFQVGWDNVLFVRTFQETITFFPKDITGLIISVAIEHAEKIREFVSENKLPVQII